MERLKRFVLLPIRSLENSKIQLIGEHVNLFCPDVYKVRILSGFLFQVKTADPLAWIVSCAVLLGITVIAVLYLPALIK